ncbi:MAG: GWxTD domain-containing protein [Saprospirales bacterium]|nr:GWxTD domain-containing protein [Saprospirales bacterium]
MKKIVGVLAGLLLMQSAIWGLDASVTFATFKAQQVQYAEIGIFIVGSTVTYLPVDSMYQQATVEVVILFKQQDAIVRFDKFQLNSPLVLRPKDFIDLKRYSLAPGQYELEVTMQDVNLAENTSTYRTNFSIDYQGEGVMQSDVQLLSSVEATGEEGPFVKNGFHMEPLPYNFYGKNAEKLILYNEIYQTDQALGDDFMVSYLIDKIDGNGNVEPVLVGHKRRTPAPVSVLLLNLDISQLESGNYRLAVEVRNRHKDLLSRKEVSFQRSNPYLRVEAENLPSAVLEEEFVGKLSEGDLIYSLKAIAPVVSSDETEWLNQLIKEGSPEAKRLYLFSYWSKKNPNNPDIPYLEYMEIAKALDQMYHSGFGYGFETDRGYVYLKYGRPDDMLKEDNDPAAPPYEIWVYNSFPVTNQTNVRFIFYNPSLAPNDFQLLHSTARGELNNPQWEIQLYRNSPTQIQGDDPFSATEMQDNFGRQARKRFDGN